MPVTQAKPKKDEPQKHVDDDTKKWKYMCVRKDVHGRLDEQRRRRAKAIGFKLSWTKFFALLADDMEKSGR